VTHLGDQVCVLIDGELVGDAHDQVAAHLAECGHCRRAVADFRRVKALVAEVDDRGEPAPDFIGRLLMIPAFESAEPLARTPRRSRSRRLLGRSAPSRPLKTGVPAPNRRPRNRTVAAAGFAASVVVGLGGAISGSAAVTATAGSVGAAGPTAPTTLPATALSAIAEPALAVVPRPGGRVAVSVVYRRP
jgi:anti-sigma factor RsiW